MAEPYGFIWPCALKVDFSGTKWGSVAGLCVHGDGYLNEAKDN